MSEWTADARKAIELSEKWAEDVTRRIRCKAYLFGSAIYQDGTQFDPIRSDLDILLVPEEIGSASSRLDLAVQLKDLKLSLELQMIPTLKRNVCDEPGASIVVATPFELEANIHKSGARNFFDRNAYLELGANDDVKLGLRGAGDIKVTDELRQAIEFVQKTRNKFLSVAANGTGGIPDHGGIDPLPKELMRAAAQVVEVEDAEAGQWYDTRLGLESLHQLLVSGRTKDKRVRDLFDSKVSVLRGGRGRTNIKLGSEDQLLLAELLFDHSYSIFQARAASDKHPLDSAIARGSDSPHLSSSDGTSLPANGSDTRLGNANQVTADGSRVDILIERIADWQPNISNDHESMWVSNLVSYLGRTIESCGLGMDGYGIPVFISVPNVSLNKRFDIVVFLNRHQGNPEILPIDVVRFSGFSQLADTLLSLPESRETIVLVIYGIPEEAEGRARDQIADFEKINTNVRIIPFISRDQVRTKG
ncbi:TPA: hypothetical protein ACJ509_001945 [Stenotrophomonas maltophilia]